MKPKGEYEQFTGALKKVLQVSHDQLKAKLDAEKQAKQDRKKQASGRASRDKD